MATLPPKSFGCCVPCSGTASTLGLAKGGKGNLFHEPILKQEYLHSWLNHPRTPAVTRRVTQAVNPGLLLALLRNLQEIHTYLFCKELSFTSFSVAETGNFATTPNNREGSSAVLVQVIKSVHKFITSFHTKINIQYETSSQRTWIAILLLINNPAAAAILLVGKYFKSFHRLAWKKQDTCNFRFSWLEFCHEKINLTFLRKHYPKHLLVTIV